MPNTEESVRMFETNCAHCLEDIMVPAYVELVNIAMDQLSK